MTSKPVVECSTEQTVNPFIVELVKLGNEYSRAYPDSNYTICKVGITTKEELRQNINNAFTDMKAKHQYMETKMSISNILDNLNLLKKEYNQIASNYNPVSYDGCDVNFSPVIAYNNSSKLYEELFQLLDENVPNHIKPFVKSEVIFLTHDAKMHDYNLIHNPKAEELLWQPTYQEIKKSTYGGYVLRYNYILKKQMIDKFKILHSNIIPWNTIRYIF